jgi:hypothetical protein
MIVQEKPAVSSDWTDIIVDSRPAWWPWLVNWFVQKHSAPGSKGTVGPFLLQPPSPEGIRSDVGNHISRHQPVHSYQQGADGQPLQEDDAALVRKLLAFTLIVVSVCVLLAHPTGVQAAPPPHMVTVMGGRTYTVNGVTRPFDAVTCFQAAPGISVMALRLFGELGAELSYDWTTGVIVMTFGQTTVTLAERSALMKISGPRGEREVILRTAVVNRNGRAYIPTRDVSEYLGFTVDWQAADNSISILVKPAEHQIGARTVEGQAEF